MLRFMFIRAMRSEMPIGCVAFNRTDNGLHYQVSVVNPKDTFDRKRARDVAAIRLEAKPIHVEWASKPTEANKFDDLRTVMSHVASNKDLPSRAIKVAKRWLKINNA